MFDIQEELKKLPAKPGVYLMHNAKDEIIYVGKARILKNRVRQYFQSSYNTVSYTHLDVYKRQDLLLSVVTDLFVEHRSYLHRELTQ